jgi:hypothetical protein
MKLAKIQLKSLQLYHVFRAETPTFGRWFSELAQEWPVVLLFFCLAASPSVIRHFFGRGWSTVAAVAVFALWLVIRPWRFKFLPQDSRRGIFIVGTVGLAMLVLVHGFLYWFSQWFSHWLAQNVAMLPNKSLQPTAAAPVSWSGVGNLVVTVAFRSRSPAAVAEFGR